jgi:prevent-host-death family protein
MTTVGFTEFRKHASDLLDRVEQGEVLVVLRHGRPVAEIAPVSAPPGRTPAWKRPGLKLVSRGASLSAAIAQERRLEDVL